MKKTHHIFRTTKTSHGLPTPVDRPRSFFIFTVAYTAAAFPTHVRQTAVPSQDGRRRVVKEVQVWMGLDLFWADLKLL